MAGMNIDLTILQFASSGSISSQFSKALRNDDQESRPAMTELLDACRRFPEKTVSAGETLIEQDTTTGKLFVVVDGEFSVHSGKTEIASVGEPGAVFGEMSLLLSTPHTASVTASKESRVYVIDDGLKFLRSDAEIMFHVAHVLAARLQMLTSYLADLKTQYGGRDDHLSMVDEVLACLSSQQEEQVTLGSERDQGPKP